MVVGGVWSYLVLPLFDYFEGRLIKRGLPGGKV